MKILINTPRLIPHGGVANHYLGLKEYWSEDVLYNPIGKRNSKSGSGVFRLPINIIKFIYLLFTFKPDVVLLNPSLSRSAVVRDVIFLRIACFFKKRVAVFFHGFDYHSINHINIKKLTKQLNRTVCIFVLAEEFKDTVSSWGVNVPIYLATTKVDDKLIANFDIEKRTGKVNTILFLARITESKGIFIALDAFKKLATKYPDLQLRVVGNGPALEQAIEKCKNEAIERVTFLGTLSGNKLISEFTASDIYLFPTYHNEGMPTSILEALAFGLPVISRPVGGTKDFFINGRMGEVTDSLDAKDFAQLMEKYIQDKKLTKEVSQFNHQYAKDHFMASKVAQRIEEHLIKSVL